MGRREAAIVEALRGVHDPCCRERGISVVDMGLLERVELDEGHAHVEIVLTSGWCPFQLDLLTEIEAAVQAVPDIENAEVTITLDTAWSGDRLSDDARSKLRFLPDPRDVDDPSAYRDRMLPLAPAVTSERSQP